MRRLANELSYKDRLIVKSSVGTVLNDTTSTFLSKRDNVCLSLRWDKVKSRSVVWLENYHYDVFSVEQGVSESISMYQKVLERPSRSNLTLYNDKFLECKGNIFDLIKTCKGIDDFFNKCSLYFDTKNYFVLLAKNRFGITSTREEPTSDTRPYGLIVLRWDPDKTVKDNLDVLKPFA